MPQLAGETAHFPTSGRFLMGRLRQALDDEHKAIIEGLFDEVRTFDDTHILQRRGQLCDTSALLVDGFMMRAIPNEGDGSHIVSLQVPGDFVDLHGFALKRLDHDVLTIGRTQIAFCPHARLEAVVRAHPKLTRILWFSTMLDAALHRNWIIKLEKLPAVQRVAFLFAETDARLRMVDLALDDGFDSPLTQTQLASICGITAVHMNRVLGELNETGIARCERGRVFIPDREKLWHYCGFDGDYLYGAGQLAVGPAPYA